MRWSKKGMIFAASEQRPWLHTHAAMPISLRIRDDIYRIYFSSRDDQNRSHVGYVEIDITSPEHILELSAEPVLAPGPLGYFDDHGVYGSCVVEHDQKLFMYTAGFSPGSRRPLFYTSVGLAVSEDRGKTFRKMFNAPIMSRTEFDPWMVGAPFVMIEGGVWRMWYLSGFKWEEVMGQLHSYYHIKYAESLDGVDWKRDGSICIDHQGGERNIARPCVVKEGDTYKMWFSYDAGSGYRIGYAESMDGYAWRRKDGDIEIEVSPSGWDSEALAYPWVFNHDGKKHMLYNGNRFGRDGFGLAVEAG